MRFGERLNGGEAVSEWMKQKSRYVQVVGASSDTISGGNRIIVFNSTGELIVNNRPLKIEYLVVGGGGGTFGDPSGGGGAGGYSTNVGGSLLEIPVGRHKIVVGAGGAAGGNGNNGEFSALGSFVVCLGGGFGAKTRDVSLNAKGVDGGTGASGGGGYAISPGVGSDVGWGGRTVSNSGTGNIGGNGDNDKGGGGGGSGSAGADVSGSAHGAGGSGTANSITGSSVTYAAGGSGGSGSAGTANTGNGAGGGGFAGGSGIVVVRYAI